MSIVCTSAAPPRSVCIGPPDPRRSYLSIPSIIAAAKNTGCDAVHPGYGFLAENAAFAEACADNDLVFIGPSPESIRRLGDKALAKRMMAEAGLPTVPGSDGAVAGVAEAAALAEEMGYPIMIKASAGGGGRGMRLVEDATELERQYLAACAEAEGAFACGDMYVEKAIVDPHHVEVQVLGDGTGRGGHLRRARLLHPAPPPEGPGRDAVAAARALDAGRASSVWPSARVQRSATPVPARSSSWSTPTSASTSWR